MNNDDIHGLSGAYAVDAVDDVERARFEADRADRAEARLRDGKPAAGVRTGAERRHAAAMQFHQAFNQRQTNP